MDVRRIPFTRSIHPVPTPDRASRDSLLVEGERTTLYIFIMCTFRFAQNAKRSIPFTRSTFPTPTTLNTPQTSLPIEGERTSFYIFIVCEYALNIPR